MTICKVKVVLHRSNPQRFVTNSTVSLCNILASIIVLVLLHTVVLFWQILTFFFVLCSADFGDVRTNLPILHSQSC